MESERPYAPEIMKKLLFAFLALAAIGCATVQKSSADPVFGKTNYVATLTTTDNTTNTIFELTPPSSNCVVRVETRFLGYNSTSCASYERIVTARVIGGTLSQVTSTATIGQHEDDTAFEGKLSVGSTTITGLVAGNTGRTVSWIAFVDVYYTN